MRLLLENPFLKLSILSVVCVCVCAWRVWQRERCADWVCECARVQQREDNMIEDSLQQNNQTRQELQFCPKVSELCTMLWYSGIHSIKARTSKRTEQSEGKLPKQTHLRLHRPLANTLYTLSDRFFHQHLFTKLVELFALDLAIYPPPPRRKICQAVWPEKLYCMQKSLFLRIKFGRFTKVNNLFHDWDFWEN